MKRLVFLFFTLFIIIDLKGQGVNCDSAIANLIVNLPYYASNETTCLQKDDYNKNNVVSCGNSDYLDGEDKIYAFTPAGSGTVLVSIIGDSLNSGIFIYEGCPDTGHCVGSNTDNSTPNKNLGIEVIQGKFYFIVIDSKPSSVLSTCLLKYDISIGPVNPICPASKVEIKNTLLNADAELGFFLNWEASNGICCPIKDTLPGFLPERQTITSGNDYDPHSEYTIPVVAPGGGNYSIRLGNDSIGGQSESLSYKIAVDADHNGVIYKYAVVFQDPGHDAANQPKFEVGVFDKDSNLVSCGYYKVVAGPSVPCFSAYLDATNALILYKNWTTVGIDLTPYIGQEVTVRFTTADCGYGGHYGYAYVDMGVFKMQIEIPNGGFCVGDTSLVLSAPDGFDNYSWSTGETTKDIIVKNPVDGTSYYVDMTPVNGFSCGTRLQTTIKAFPKPISDFSLPDSICVGDTLKLVDKSSLVNGKPTDTIANWYWEFGDNTVSTQKNPKHKFLNTGLYNIKLISGESASCVDSIEKKIKVFGIPLFKISASDSVVCKNKPLNLNTNISNVNNYFFNWSNGDNNSQTIVQPASSGYYYLNLLSKVSSTCGRADSIYIQVIDHIDTPQVACQADSVTVKFFWDSVANANAYQYSTDAGSSWKNTLNNGQDNFIEFNASQINENFQVQVKATNSVLCNETISNVISACTDNPLNDPNHYLHLPDAFSPNGDQGNDSFKPFYAGVDLFEMHIYDRWGKLIFKSKNIDEGWDGTSMNEHLSCPLGIYFYVINYTFSNGQKFNTVNSVTLIR